LYLPREWAQDAERRQQAEVPEEIAFHGSVCHVSLQQLNLAEFLHSKATPYAPAFWDLRLGTITASSKLIAQDVQSA
jgi:hypothetical protein